MGFFIALLELIVYTLRKIIGFWNGVATENLHARS